MLTLLLLVFLSSCSQNISEALDNVKNFSLPVTETAPEVPVAPDQINAVEGDDPLSSELWHIKNTGQKSYAKIGGFIGEDINFTNIHSTQFQGEGIKIAISDNGVQIYHPDLVANSWFGQHRNYSYNNSDYWNSDPTPDGDVDTDAHGTAVTGIIASTYNNSIGTRGVAAKAKFGGFLYVGTPYDLIKTLDQANGPFDIFNYSYGRNTCYFQDLSEAIILQLDYGVTNLRAGKGAIYVKASGNEYFASTSNCVEGEEGYYLGNASLEEDNSFPFMIVVGANTAYGNTASYSTPGSSLWLSAPGGDYGINYPALISTDLTGCDKGFANSENGFNDFDLGKIDNENCDYTSTMNGTSAAAPVVSGAVAILLEARNELTWRDIKYILALSSRQIDAKRGDSTSHPLSNRNLSGAIYEYGWQKNSAGFNFHNWYGFGALDLDKALEIAKTFPSLGNSIFSSAWRNESNTVNKVIPDNDSNGVSDTISVQDNLSIEAVQIRLTIEHAHASELGVVLESPSGMKSTLLYYNSGMVQSNLIDEILLSNAFLGESSRGDWKLKVFDGSEGNVGNLVNWKINFWGHYPDGREGERLIDYYNDSSSQSSTQVVTSDRSINGSLEVTIVENDQKITLNSIKTKLSNKLDIISLYKNALSSIYQAHSNLSEQSVKIEKVYFNKNFNFIFSNEKEFLFINHKGEILNTLAKDEVLEVSYLNDVPVWINIQKELVVSNNKYPIKEQIKYFENSNEKLFIVTSNLEDSFNVWKINENEKNENKVFEKYNERIFLVEEKQKIIHTLNHHDKTITKLSYENGQNIAPVYQFKFPYQVMYSFSYSGGYNLIVRDDREERAYYYKLNEKLKPIGFNEIFISRHRDKIIQINDLLFIVNKKEIKELTLEVKQ